MFLVRTFSKKGEGGPYYLLFFFNTLTHGVRTIATAKAVNLNTAQNSALTMPGMVSLVPGWLRLKRFCTGTWGEGISFLREFN